MRAEIAFGRRHDGLQSNEFDRLARRQHLERGHDLQTYGLMDDRVGLFHGHTLRSQKPARTKPPPPMKAIHKRKWSCR